MSWSKANRDTVISGDETGNLVVLDMRGNTTRSINFGKHCIYVLECHPFDSDVVAFGCRLGLVFIVNITGKHLSYLGGQRRSHVVNVFKCKILWLSIVSF